MRHCGICSAAPRGRSRDPHALCLGGSWYLKAAPASLSEPSASARRHSVPASPLCRRGLCSRPGSKGEEEAVPGEAACAVHPPARSRGTCSGLLEVTKCRICIIGSVLLRRRVQNTVRYRPWVGRCPPVSAELQPWVLIASLVLYSRFLGSFGSCFVCVQCMFARAGAALPVATAVREQNNRKIVFHVILHIFTIYVGLPSRRQ